MIRVSSDISSKLLLTLDTCVTGISNPDCSAPILVPVDEIDSLVFDFLDLGGRICLWVRLINSFIGLPFDDECFVFLTTLDLSFCVS